MTILAIDPGTTESAYVVYEPENKRVLKFGKLENQQLERMLHDRAFAVEDEFDSHSLLVYEMFASYGMPVGKEVFETCLWIGRFLQSFDRGVHSNFVYRLYRKQIVTHLCGSAKAKDANVRRALLDRFGATDKEALGCKAAPGPLYGISKDAWSALAIAVTFADTRPDVWRKKEAA